MTVPMYSERSTYHSSVTGTPQCVRTAPAPLDVLSKFSCASVTRSVLTPSSSHIASSPAMYESRTALVGLTRRAIKAQCMSIRGRAVSCCRPGSSSRSSIGRGFARLRLIASDLLDDALGVLAADVDVERVRVAPGCPRWMVDSRPLTSHH